MPLLAQTSSYTAAHISAVCLFKILRRLIYVRVEPIIESLHTLSHFARSEINCHPIHRKFGIIPLQREEFAAKSNVNRKIFCKCCCRQVASTKALDCERSGEARKGGLRCKEGRTNYGNKAQKRCQDNRGTRRLPGCNCPK